jgi:hypothetical protein
MTMQPNPVANQFQRVANDIAARLAQLAKEPPDLLTYFRVHAECIATSLQPAGFAYEMQNGQSFQRLLHSNLESLNYPGMPEQENSFLRAVKLAATQRKPVRIGPHTLPSAGLHGLTVEDAPAPEELPIYNRTAFEQVFIPIPMGQTTVGVLHIWFEPGTPEFSQGRVALLQKVCGEVELYLKARRLSDISQEVTRLTTYARLLESLSGDLDLESVGWNIVNFARETVACDRVCLFVAKHYEQPLPGAPVHSMLEYDFELHACSGLKTVNPRSEQAVILREVAQRLVRNTLALPEPAPSVALSAAADQGGTPEASAPLGAKPANHKPAPPVQKPPGRPAVRMNLISRSMSQDGHREPEVVEYFEVMPMNWATVLPLFDRNDRVCGIFLFEGVKPAENLSITFLRMLDLSNSAGRALGTALYWNRQPALRVAQRWVRARQTYINTPRKRKLMKFGLPVLLVTLGLLCPIDYTLKGEATVLPTAQVALPAQVAARLVRVQVREGEHVKKDQVLAQLDTRDLMLQLRQMEQEYERSLLESQTAMSLGDEPRMQLARLNAAKAEAIADKIRHDLANSTLRAPIDGLVLGAQSLATRIGEVMRVGERVLEVVDPSQWQVKVSLREQDLIFLSERLHTQNRIPVTLALAANPAHKYLLELNTSEQIAYGLDTARGKYEFSVMLPLDRTLEDTSLFKSGFGGRAKFNTGKKPVAYMLFRDFINYFRVRFL